MKKLKVMLLSFALIAAVGAALAFKTKYINAFCTAATDLGATPCRTTKSCPTLINNRQQGTTGTFICTAMPINNSCNGVNCTTTSAQLIPDGGF